MCLEGWTCFCGNIRYFVAGGDSNGHIQFLYWHHEHDPHIIVPKAAAAAPPPADGLALGPRGGTWAVPPKAPPSPELWAPAAKAPPRVAGY